MYVGSMEETEQTSAIGIRVLPTYVPVCTLQPLYYLLVSQWYCIYFTKLGRKEQSVELADITFSRHPNLRVSML